MDWLIRTSGGFVSCALASAGVLIGGLAPAFSHHPSGASSSGASGPIITIPGITLEKGAGAVVFAFEHISFDELSDATLEAAASRHEHAHSLGSIESPSLGFAYGVTDRLMFSLLLPYVLRTDIREAHHHHHEDGEVENETVDRGDTEGIGDLTLLGQYQFLGQGAELQASLLAGLKAPTGETGERDAEGELFETEFQPGSGSWDGLIGVAVSKPIGKWSLDGNVLYTIATEGAEQTDLGDRFHYNGSLSYRVWGGAEGEREHIHTGHEHIHTGHAHHADGLALDLVLELNGEWQAKQVISRETDPNSGGNVVYLSPGVRLTANKLSGFLSVGLPIVNDLNGLQSESTYRLLGGLVRSF